jgi:hypothetical protein
MKIRNLQTKKVLYHWAQGMIVRSFLNRHKFPLKRQKTIKIKKKTLKKNLLPTFEILIKGLTFLKASGQKKLS